MVLALVTGLPSPGRLLPRLLGRVPGGQNTPVGPSERVLVGGDWVVIFSTTYRQCGDTVIDTGPPPQEMIGLNLEGIRNLYPEWTVATFEKGKAQLTRSIDGLCPDMERFRYVKLEGDRVNIYYGRPPKLMFKEFIVLEVEGLRQADRDRLSQGVTVEGDDGVAELLEGLGD
jgi:hypothetical protein